MKKLIPVIVSVFAGLFVWVFLSVVGVVTFDVNAKEAFCLMLDAILMACLEPRFALGGLIVSACLFGLGFVICYLSVFMFDLTKSMMNPLGKKK